MAIIGTVGGGSRTITRVVQAGSSPFSYTCPSNSKAGLHLASNGGVGVVSNAGSLGSPQIFGGSPAAGWRVGNRYQISPGQTVSSSGGNYVYFDVLVETF